jgi:hypothetical protein
MCLLALVELFGALGPLLLNLDAAYFRRFKLTARPWTW